MARMACQGDGISYIQLQNMVWPVNLFTSWGFNEMTAMKASENALSNFPDNWLQCGLKEKSSPIAETKTAKGQGTSTPTEVLNL